MLFNVSLAADIIPELVRGLFWTVVVFLPVLPIGALIAFFLAFGKRSKNTVIRGIATLTSIFCRGTPILLLVYLVYNGLANVWWVRDTFLWSFFKDPYNCTILAFSLNHAAFLSVIIDGAWKVIPKPVLDAATALGLFRSVIFIKIEFPLIARYGFSAYRNELILFFKATSILGAVTILDLTGVAKQVVSKYYDPFTPFIVVGAMYWACIQVIQFILGLIEKRLRRPFEVGTT
jgi:polar amino acid transport system permease protein/arginine/ornithine transport system permease protein